MLAQRGLAVVVSAEVTKRVVRFGLFEANLSEGLLTKSGIRIKLQDQPFRILTMLLERPGEVVGRDEIRKKLWPEDTFVEFDDGLNTAIRKLRFALSDSADNPRFVETVPRRGYRFLAPVTLPVPATLPTIDPPAPEIVPPPAGADTKREGQPARRYFLIGIVLAAIAFSILGVWKFRHRASTPFGSQSQDLIVLADFENTTDENVFDDALKQALAVDLEQSPFLRLLSDRRVSEMLRLMQLSPSDRLTQKVAIEVCNRSTGKAMIAGSISNLGSKYLVGLTAVQCSTGDAIAHEQVEANRKEEVVEALGKVASLLRARLGESLASIQQHDVPLEQATTFSLDALRAYNLGLKTWDKEGDKAAVPFFKHATELDPNFAMAYAGLSSMYNNLGESVLGAENITKAYELRDRLTETERFSIESRYYTHATGELDKAEQVYQLQQQTHPDSISAHSNLGNIYASTGKQEKALVEYRAAIRLDPGRAPSYANLADTCLALNRMDEAEQAISEARKRRLNGEYLLQIRYWLAFLRDDSTEMQRVASEASQQSGTDALLLFLEANTQAYHGHIRKSRELTNKAVELAERTGDREVAAEYLGESALREAELGETASARRYAQLALALAPGRDMQTLAALTLARTRDAQRARALSDDLNKRFPAHTLLQEYWLPLIQASLELDRGKASKAIEILEPAAAFDLAEPPPVSLTTLYLPYLRGSAYLAEGDGERAAAQYQKFLEHRTVIANQPLGALAYVGLGRAYAQERYIETSRTAYETFFSLWKDADPDIPILREAKAEYAKLR
jgi:DNA-binding winged helix-turn-helix (wHTH) protein/predicted Zn-dependent protease